MPRQARLDAPGVLHHVMVRRRERRAIFRDDTDCAAFVARLAERGALPVYAWALLPTHARLLVGRGTRPLPRSMRGLLTDFAGAFHRRDHRVGAGPRPSPEPGRGSPTSGRWSSATQAGPSPLSSGSTRR